MNIDEDVLRDVEAALETMLGYGCPQCGGDCASANPPVACCPVKANYAALAKLRKAMEDGKDG